MSTVRAKFHVLSKEEVSSGNPEKPGVFNVTLDPVRDGSPENADFYAWTPSGKIVLQTLNPSAAEAFKPGKNMYVDFTPAE